MAKSLSERPNITARRISRLVNYGTIQDVLNSNLPANFKAACLDLGRRVADQGARRGSKL